MGQSFSLLMPIWLVWTNPVPIGFRPLILLFIDSDKFQNESKNYVFNKSIQLLVNADEYIIDSAKNSYV